jgi:nitroreductase
MELKKVIETRTSVRSFKSDPVPLEDIREMVRLAGLAPSANNFQPWSFILITDKEMLRSMADTVSKRLQDYPGKNTKLTANIKAQVEWYSTFFRDAPAVLAVIIDDYETVWEKGIDMKHKEINEMRNFPDIQSAGACIQNLLLAAVDMGYGACWLSGPMVAKKDMELSLEIRKPSWLLSFVAIGIPSTSSNPKKKENLGEKLKVIS